MADDKKHSIERSDLDDSLWAALLSASPRTDESPTTVANLLSELIRQGVNVLQEYRHATAQLHTERLRGVTTLTAKELLEVVFRDGERPQHIEVDGTTNNYLGISSVMIDYQERRDNAARQRAFEYDPPIKQLHAKIGDDVTVKFTRDR